MANEIPSTEQPVVIKLISARNGEFVGFIDNSDAEWTAGNHRRTNMGIPSLGEAFRDLYAKGERSKFPVARITLTAEQAAALKIPKDKR